MINGEVNDTCAALNVAACLLDEALSVNGRGKYQRQMSDVVLR
jgi:hypothetical protein